MQLPDLANFEAFPEPYCTTSMKSIVPDPVNSSVPGAENENGNSALETRPPHTEAAGLAAGTVESGQTRRASGASLRKSGANAGENGLSLAGSPRETRAGDARDNDVRDPILVALGERIRNLRARRGMTRKETAQAAGISERHMANLESGMGNATLLILHQLAHALRCSLAEVLGDVTTSSPEWLLLREMLEGRSEAELHRARVTLSALFGTTDDAQGRKRRIALIGLRGAGKSTLGRMLAEDFGYPFIELSREVERIAGCSITEIHSLYGASAYRRYERRALEDVLQRCQQVVMATPGGVVSDASTFNMLLTHCYTVWLQAEPEEHMRRVIEQGDFRPMAGSREAMDDLKLILSGRAPFYAKADMSFDTSMQSVDEAFEALRNRLRKALAGADTR